MTMAQKEALFLLQSPLSLKHIMKIQIKIVTKDLRLKSAPIIGLRVIYLFLNKLHNHLFFSKEVRNLHVSIKFDNIYLNDDEL